ncbi:MAG: hypothetical protein H8E21_02915 [Gammaproteobacteria bacterium]|nr:hypothetical protein [Gammaproteobacteria bacterium]
MVAGFKWRWLAELRLLCGFMLLWLYIPPVLAAELTVMLDKAESEMGKYFLADIRYRGEPTDAEFNLSEWTAEFHLSAHNRQTLALENGGIQKSLSVRLYPRHSGQLTLASIAFAGVIAESTSVTVEPSIRNLIDATPRLQPLRDFYWSDQAIMIQLDVALHDPRNRVDADEFELEGFRVQALKPQRLSSAEGEFVRLQWMLITPSKGHVEIELPAIYQRGRGQFRYHLTQQILHIKPLPAYLPATIPVGQISVHSELQRIRNQPAWWRIDIKKIGYLPPQLEGLQEFIDSLGIDPDRVEIEQTHNSESGDAELRYRIPVPEWYFARPDRITFPYFDTETSQLNTLSHTLPVIWQVPPYMLVASLFLLMIVMFYAGYRLNKVAEQIRHWRRLRRHIKQADSAHSLRRLLTAGLAVKTLSEWSAQYPTALTQRIAQDLNQYCFANQASQELDQIKIRCLRFFTFAHTRRSVSSINSEPSASAGSG